MRTKQENTKPTLLRRALACLVSAVMVVAFTPVVVWGAEGDVEYRSCDVNGANWTTGTKSAGEYKVVTSSDTSWGTSGTTTWYVVNSDVTIERRIVVNGDVHLILVDGCTLTAKVGIRVSDDDNNPSNGSTRELSIYGQTLGTGSLTVDGLESLRSAHAAIGGNGANIDNDAQCGGTVTINGGIITISSFSGAGIGGGGGINSGNHGDGNSGGNVTINGGTVNATSMYGAGIGGGGGLYGGISGSGGNVTISGGTVNATSKYGAGIGGGRGQNGGTFKTQEDAASNGNAVVFASSIGDQTGKESDATNPWHGVIFKGNSGKVYGESVAPSEDFTIPADKTLTIESGHALVIKQGVTLINRGKIYVDGTFIGTADNLYYPLTLVRATASENTSEYNSRNYGKAGSEITCNPAN